MIMTKTDPLYAAMLISKDENKSGFSTSPLKYLLIYRSNHKKVDYVLTKPNPKTLNILEPTYTTINISELKMTFTA